ncbi:valyl-tRNA synthetase [Terriglobus roseus DSM 18391]|uniref:Valine--tRNA ligase n=1 Tax=Terriglobus roseus (strain DSM 18391 / NRRL B-41598 / KBS 63) TaxID=926566 RepID=I3ZDM4_TERRK|nr:valine--tRNA ligase [Terriglobus roseus]AFL87342.1 valyl-tRNA synthetase [Terriglobus roseus DSM 18391]
MPNELPKAYDPAAIEQKWADFWVTEKLFDTPANAEATSKPFVMLLPPPNVTGRLHMGHMLNQTEMDILARWHRMRGEESVWVPGTDHAGIATQMMVEKQLKAEGTNRKELGRDAFLNRVWDWKAQYGGAITGQMRRLGASVDWGREYFTMDDNLSSAVTEAFVRLHEQGLIYRGSYIVNWDPVQQTAVSDLEVEHKEIVGKIYHLRYPFADGSGSIVIATTRPETMLGDVAVVVNPTDERYTGFLGKTIKLPLTDREIPILADDWAKPEFGTGAVKVTPAHDPNDYEIGKRHNLANLTIMDETAHIDLQGSPYHGMDRYEAREKILADLDALGLLVEVKDHTLAIATSQRSGAVIEPRLSMQWFLKIQPLADKAIGAVKEGHVRFTPPMYEKTYMNWMENIHDWCISRQLWWGHRIPAYHCPECKTTCVSRTRPDRCGSCDHAELQQETDVLDTWFSAGLLPFTVFGWPEPSQDSAKFYPTDLLVTGFDILFFWVARMIMFGTHFMLDVPMPDGSKRELKDAVPFREVYIHALVRDADRQKMSKTKGNVVDPIEVIERFGTDAVRFTLASQASPGTDIAFSEARTEGYRAFANKIWNAARFLFMQVERAKLSGYKMTMGAAMTVSALPEITPIETRWIFARLRAVCAEVDRALSDYRFDEAANAVYQFFWGEFCDWYLELVKLRLEFPEPVEGVEPIQYPETAISLAGLVGVFEASLRLLSPFMPFLTEEIWNSLYEGKPPAKSIALTHFPQASDYPADDTAVSAIDTLQSLIVTVRGLRKELGVPEKEAAPITLHGDNRILALADANRDMLARMARVSEVEFAPEPLTGANVRSGTGFDVTVAYERQIDVPAERERLTKEIVKFTKGLEAANRQLGNESFVAKAPAAVVEGLKKQQAETQSLYDKAKAALEALPPE